MAGETEQLYQALVSRDKVRGYLSNLEGLRTDGSITEEQYELAKKEYSGQESDVSSEIESLKSQLQPRLDGIEQELADARFQLGSFETRLKVGEITQAKYDAERRKLGRQIETLETEREELASLVEADTAPSRHAPAPEPVRPPKTAVEPKPPRSRRERTPSAPRAAGPRFSARDIAQSKPRLAALICSVILLVSVRMAWVGPSEMMGTGTPPTPGVVTSFLAGLAGFLGGLAGIAAAFLRSGRARGILHICVGVLAFLALGAGILLGELPLHNAYFRELIVLREGFFLYVAIALALFVVGILEMRED